MHAMRCKQVPEPASPLHQGQQGAVIFAAYATAQTEGQPTGDPVDSDPHAHTCRTGDGPYPPSPGHRPTPGAHEARPQASQGQSRAREPRGQGEGTAKAGAATLPIRKTVETVHPAPRCNRSAPRCQVTRIPSGRWVERPAYPHPTQTPRRQSVRLPRQSLARVLITPVPT